MTYPLSIRIAGFLISLLLTLLAYLIIAKPGFFFASPTLDFFFLLVLAILQFFAQTVCFLHVLSEKGARWNLLVFLSTLSILLIIIAGSIWIMHHLNSSHMH